MNIVGFEMGDNSEALSTSGTFSVQGTTKRTGDYGLRCNPATTAVGCFEVAGHGSNGRLALYSKATTYNKVALRIDTRPSSLYEYIITLLDTVGVRKLGIVLNSNGTLGAYDAAGSLIANGTTVIPTGVFHRIEIKCGTGATAAWELLINGVTELSGTSAVGTSNNGSLMLGKNVDTNGKSIDVYFDDVVIDDAAYPGTGDIQRMDPDGNGNYTAWTGTFADVDETPHDGDTTYITSTTDTAAETESLESAASAGITGTVKAVRGFVIGARIAALGNSFVTRLRSGSTDSDTSGAGVGAYELLGKVFVTDPATGAAWLLAALDSIEVGCVISGSGAEHRCTKVGAMVEFEPAGSPGTPPAGTRCLLGVGR